MSKEGTLITIGVLVFLTPFLGLPSSWLTWILPVLGVVILVIAQILRKHRAAPQLTHMEAAPVRETMVADVPSAVA